MLKPVKETWRRIHQAIHDGSMFVTIDNKPVKVGKSGKGLRYVLYSDMELGPCTFMEQNKEKQSEYAERARNGETLTWECHRIPLNPGSSSISRYRRR